MRVQNIRGLPRKTRACPKTRATLPLAIIGDIAGLMAFYAPAVVARKTLARRAQRCHLSHGLALAATLPMDAIILFLTMIVAGLILVGDAFAIAMMMTALSSVRKPIMTRIGALARKAVPIIARQLLCWESQRMNRPITKRGSYRGTYRPYIFSFLIAVVCYFGGGLNSHAVIASPNETVQSLYQRCASCHLPNGAGIPQAFPPLVAHIDRFFDTQIGRDYLIQITIRGMRGKIEVNGATYRGVMPAIIARADDANIAALLNELVERFGTDAQRKQLPLFDKKQVSRVKQAQPKKHKEVLAMREAALQAARESE